ncbi:MAG: Crp/Fnr family transcriptional regulator [bacterium]|nr:Crp/Fnr family transcriptional regulator [bacterium]
MLDTESSKRALRKIFESGTKLSYKKGELIVRPNEKPDGVFYVVSGLVKAYDITKYGEENLLIIRKENEIFPLIRTLSGNTLMIVYEATTPVEVLRLDQKTYLEHVENNVEITLAVLDLVVEMYRLHSERIINLEYRSVRERLVSFLLITAKRFGKITKEGILIDLPLKHQDIASSINSSRETTSRNLSALIAKGQIKNVHSKITILKEDELRKYL